MKQILTQIEINAPVEKVWGILTDFKKFPEWNPMIRKLTGKVQPGETITVSLEQPGGSKMTFQPTVKTFEPNKSFSWQGKVIISGLFDGEHIFELQPTPSGTLFIHKENFKGILIPLFNKMLDTKTRQGFELMNQKLKERAES